MGISEELRFLSGEFEEKDLRMLLCLKVNEKQGVYVGTGQDSTVE